MFLKEHTISNTNSIKAGNHENAGVVNGTTALQKVYNNNFYNDHKNETLRSAEVIVPRVLDIFPVHSVIDIGCGTGAWLSVFQKCGVSYIKGYDVSHLSTEEYFIEPGCIVTDCDLSSPLFQIPETSELVSCLEVAEHLPDSASDRLVWNLTQTAPVVLFSAAFPGQTGVNHINEQPPWYWRKKFYQQGYIEIDYLRPHIWSDRRISWWYRQNITVYVKQSFLQTNSRATDLALRYPELKEPAKLTMVSERLLKKLLVIAQGSGEKMPKQTIPDSKDRQDSDNIQELLQKIQSDMSRNDYNVALQKLNIVARVHPRLPRIHFFRAICYERLGQYWEANLAIQEELKNNPGHSESNLFLKNIEQKLNEHQPKTETIGNPSALWLKTIYHGKKINDESK